MINDIHDPSSCDINRSIVTVSKVSIDFIFKSIHQPSIIINQPNIIIDVNSNIASKNHHHDDTNNSDGMKDNINNNHNIHDADNYDDNRTSYYYTGRHDNGHLPILQTSNKEALELLSSLLEAKNKCDNYLTSCIDHEYGYNNTNNCTNNISSKDINGEAVVNDVVDIDRVPDTAEDDDDDAIDVDRVPDTAEDDDDNNNESSVVTKKIKLDNNIVSCCNSKAIN